MTPKTKARAQLAAPLLLLAAILGVGLFYQPLANLCNTPGDPCTDKAWGEPTPTACIDLCPTISLTISIGAILSLAALVTIALKIRPRAASPAAYSDATPDSSSCDATSRDVATAPSKDVVSDASAPVHERHNTRASERQP